MSSFLATYDPDEVIIQLGDVDLVGFAEGTMVSVERNEDLFNNYVGTKGEVSRAVNRNKTGAITVRLQATSPSVGTIMSLIQADSTLGIPPILTFTVKDPSSFDQVFAAQVWVNVDATHEWGNEVGEREFQFFAVNMESGPNQNINGALSLASSFDVL